MTTFEDARLAVARAVRPMWRPEQGTLVTQQTGQQDAQGWHVVAGAREYLRDGDEAYAWVDAPIFLVDKTTGAVQQAYLSDVRSRLDAMTPAGGEDG